MAETARERTPSELSDIESWPQADQDETNKGKSPQIGNAMATFLLERGPYAARLEAAERLLDTNRSFAADKRMAEYVDHDYLERLRKNAYLMHAELIDFDSTTLSPEEPSEIKVPSPASQPHG